MKLFFKQVKKQRRNEGKYMERHTECKAPRAHTHSE